MVNSNIYKDIANRTGGDIYIGAGVIIGLNFSYLLPVYKML